MVSLTLPLPPVAKIPEETIFTLPGIRWSTYQAILADVGDDRPWRIAYDRGVLELRMPHLKHEKPKRLLENFVEVIADFLERELLAGGALLLEREDLRRAIEPDSCFYLEHESQVRGNQTIKLPDDPPPDLAIESDYTSSSLNKLAIYAALGVPELWRYRQGELEIYRLREGEYQRENQSVIFPFLPVAEIPSFIARANEIGHRATVRLFRKRIEELLTSRD